IVVQAFVQHLCGSDKEEDGEERESPPGPAHSRETRTDGVQANRGQNAEKRYQQKIVALKSRTGHGDVQAQRQRQPSAQVEFGTERAAPMVLLAHEEQSGDRK